ncbi:MAG: ABC transporter ATP-binding protein [Candidatus Poribacteria bacterium]|nr:ABC transporter ATP-binding protein [Candidatus Poribacteria bacterium]
MSTAETPTGTLDELPESIENTLNTLDIKFNHIRFAVKSDVISAGTFGEEWFILTDAAIFTVTGVGDVIHYIPYETVFGIRAEMVVDAGLLVLETHEGTVDLIRYSNGCAAKFGFVARFLGDEIAFRDGERDEEPIWDYKVEEHSCKTCGLPLADEYSPCPSCTKKHRVMLRILTYMQPYKGRTLLFILFVIASTLISLIPPYFIRILVDDILLLNIADNPTTDGGTTWLGDTFRSIQPVALALSIAVGALLTTHIISTLLMILHSRLTAWLTLRIAANIREHVYEHLHNLSIRFFDKRTTGTVISHITEDSERLQDFLLEGLSFIGRDVFLLFGIGIMLFLMNWQLAFFVLIPIPIIIIGGGWFWRKVRSLWHRAWRRRSKLFDVVNDSVSGIRVVRAFGRQNSEVSRFGEANIDARDFETKAEMVWATYYPPLMFAVNFGSLIVWYVGGFNILGGSMTFGLLIMFNTYLTMFYGPLRYISPLINWASRSMTAAERLFEVIDSQPEQYDDGNLIALPNIIGEVKFHNMTFGYDSHKPVLKDINLHVKPGEMIGLVGHSGAGKSTLINLICRFYSPDSGRLEIDGEDIKQINLKDLRRQIGVVLQEPYLFSGTIAENIAYANPDSSMEEIITAAKAANAHDFILKFPDGYDAEVGERGGSLSGGERQRISIARAILHNPRILILDEATSSVDVETEKQIQQAIDRLVKNRTTFAIAHRLSTLRNADRLFVIEKGRGVECGSHEELMEKKGIYYKLVETQRDAANVRAEAQIVER